VVSSGCLGDESKPEGLTSPRPPPRHMRVAGPHFRVHFVPEDGRSATWSGGGGVFILASRYFQLAHNPSVPPAARQPPLTFPCSARPGDPVVITLLAMSAVHDLALTHQMGWSRAVRTACESVTANQESANQESANQESANQESANQESANVSLPATESAPTCVGGETDS
jgi:hypothetical protein